MPPIVPLESLGFKGIAWVGLRRSDHRLSAEEGMFSSLKQWVARLYGCVRDDVGRWENILNGAGGGNRTRTLFPKPDFESVWYVYDGLRCRQMNLEKPVG